MDKELRRNLLELELNERFSQISTLAARWERAEVGDKCRYRSQIRALEQRTAEIRNRIMRLEHEDRGLWARGVAIYERICEICADGLQRWIDSIDDRYIMRWPHEPTSASGPGRPSVAND